MKQLKNILAFLGEIKNALILMAFFIGGYEVFYDNLVDDVATEVVARTGDQNYRMYKLSRAQDSIRFDMAADLAAQMLVKQDSITFVLHSINQWQQDIDRRIGQMAKKISEDTIQSAHQRELFEIRRLLRAKEASEEARIETEEAMRQFIRESLNKINQIKKGDRAQ